MAGPIKRRHNTACSAKQECQGRRRAWVNGAVAISNCLIVSGQGACVFILPWAYAKYVASPPNRTQKHSTHPSGGYTWRTLGPRVESGWPNQAAIWMEKDDSGGCGGGGGTFFPAWKWLWKQTVPIDENFCWRGGKGLMTNRHFITVLRCCPRLPEEPSQCRPWPLPPPAPGTWNCFASRHRGSACRDTRM